MQKSYATKLMITNKKEGTNIRREPEKGYKRKERSVCK